MRDDLWRKHDAQDLVDPNFYVWYGEPQRSIYRRIAHAVCRRYGLHAPCPSGFDDYARNAGELMAAADPDWAGQSAGSHQDHPASEAARLARSLGCDCVYTLGLQANPFAFWPTWLNLVGPAGSGKSRMAYVIAWVLHSLVDTSFELVDFQGHLQSPLDLTDLMDDMRARKRTVMLIDHFFEGLPAYTPDADEPSAAGDWNAALARLWSRLGPHGETTIALSCNESIFVTTDNSPYEEQVFGSFDCPATPETVVLLIKTTLDEATPPRLSLEDYWIRGFGAAVIGRSRTPGAGSEEPDGNSAWAAECTAAGKRFLSDIAKEYLWLCKENGTDAAGSRVERAVRDYLNNMPTVNQGGLEYLADALRHEAGL